MEAPVWLRSLGG